MRKYFQNLQSFVIVVLILIILLLRNCSASKPSAETVNIAKVTVRYDTIVKYVHNYIPKYVTKVEYIHDTIIDKRPVDTLAILNDYFTIYVYEDKQSLDSLNIIIKDSITQNKIVSRSIDYELIYPITTITKEVYANNKDFYWGLDLNGTFNQLNYLGGKVLYKTKSKHIYGIGAGVNQDFTPIISGSLYWKIGK